MNEKLKLTIHLTTLALASAAVIALCASAIMLPFILWKLL